MLFYQILASVLHGKIQKSHTKTINLIYQLQRRMKNLNYLMDHIMGQILKIILSISSKRHETLTDNPTIRIYVNKIENRITFRIESRYYLQLLTPETMKLLGSTENKITRNENGEDVPHLEITEVVLVRVILSTMIINKTQESCIHLFPINRLVNCWISHLKISYF